MSDGCIEGCEVGCQEGREDGCSDGCLVGSDGCRRGCLSREGCLDRQRRETDHLSCCCLPLLCFFFSIAPIELLSIAPIALLLSRPHCHIISPHCVVVVAPPFRCRFLVALMLTPPSLLSSSHYPVAVAPIAILFPLSVMLLLPQFRCCPLVALLLFPSFRCCPPIALLLTPHCFVFVGPIALLLSPLLSPLSMFLCLLAHLFVCLYGSSIGHLLSLFG